MPTSQTQTGLLVGALLFIFGALVNHLWNKYRTRLRTLRWSAQYVRVAQAAEDPRIGKVEVLYNGNPVTNLHAALIKVANASASDLEKVVANMACLEASTILMAFGYLEGSLQYLPFTDAYMKELVGAKGQQASDVLTRRDFLIPVFNRGAQANFYLLLSRSDAKQPLVTLACTHVGVKLTPEPTGIMLWSVPQLQAAVVGGIITLAIATLLAVLTSSIWLVAIAGWFAGFWAAGVGVVAIKVWRLVLRILD